MSRGQETHSKVRALLEGDSNLKKRWMESYPRPEIGKQLFEATGLLLEQLRQTRSLAFTEGNNLSDEDLRQTESLVKILGTQLLHRENFDTSQVQVPDHLRGIKPASDNESLVAFEKIFEVLEALASSPDPYKALTAALQTGATGYQKGLDPFPILEKAKDSHNKVLIATAYSSGVILTSILEAYAREHQLPFLFENWLTRPFNDDDLFLSVDELRELRKKHRVVTPVQEGVTDIVRFDDSSQRNERLQLEGSTMMILRNLLETRYPQAQIFNTSPNRRY